MNIEIATANDREAWDAFVTAQPQANFYHLYNWKRVFQESFGCQTAYLMAQSKFEIKGVLPLFIIKNYLLGGNYISSLPGGVCAADEETSHQLIEAAINLTKVKKAKYLRLRDGRQFWSADKLDTRIGYTYVLDNLPPNPDIFWHKLRSTVRTRVRKARKEKLVTAWDNSKLDAFYRVYMTNMRDLGTPAIPHRFFKLATDLFPDMIKLLTVQQADRVIGGMYFSSFNQILSNPFASSLRESFQLCPNDLLYWEAIRYVCENGYQKLDLGTSIENSGHARFKEKFLAMPQKIFQQYHLNSANSLPASRGGNIYHALSKVWRYLPLPIANGFSPIIRRMIPLG